MWVQLDQSCITRGNNYINRVSNVDTVRSIMYHKGKQLDQSCIKSGYSQINHQSVSKEDTVRLIMYQKWI